MLDPTANALRASFRRMTPPEAAALKPLRIRVVTVRPGDTLATLSARMLGTDRKLDLFRLINAMPMTVDREARRQGEDHLGMSPRGTARQTKKPA